MEEPRRSSVPRVHPRDELIEWQQAQFGRSFVGEKFAKKALISNPGPSEHCRDQQVIPSVDDVQVKAILCRDAM